TDEPVEDWNELMQKMNELEQDTTLTQFLNAEFRNEKYDALRSSALQYAQGFDAVDPEKASVFALRDEWQQEEEDTYRIEGGYAKLINHLLEVCKQHNAVILLHKPVAAIEWKMGEVKITTTEQEVFYAKQAIVTVPAGVLAADEEAPNFIQFKPGLPQIQKAAKEMGYGNVIKILFQFSSFFWQKQKDALFFLSDQTIATWWSQCPSSYPLLTGWIAGKKADDFIGMKEEEIKRLALQSLAHIFNKKEEELTQWLTACHIVNWQNDVYAKGAYFFGTIASEEAKGVMNKPIESTLFFGGEALYSGASGGTVEAALVSGLSVAKKMLEE
ncbi:MAG: FAD-dependent oxidoreductase, partial [Bacteroidota bacterium]|nr:FAD-dependent oxidoreductase [Bacteroidota bacterium]